MKPSISIIILTWNTAQITLKCVRSVNRSLAGKLNYEIIVADNASTDDTVKLLSQEPKVTLVKNKHNYGFAKGNNYGVKQAKADYYFFINSDIELIDHQLVDMLNFLKSNPQIGVLGPMFLNPDLSLQDSVFPPQTALNAFREYFLSQKYSFSKHNPSNPNPSSVNSISGGALLISKTLFQKINGWDERYHMYFEDLELCRQVKKQGKLVYFYPQMKIIHRHGASGIKLASPQNQWRRLIPSSKIYYGTIQHYFISLILWLGQKWQKLLH